VGILTDHLAYSVVVFEGSTGRLERVLTKRHNIIHHRSLPLDEKIMT